LLEKKHGITIIIKKENPTTRNKIYNNKKENITTRRKMK